MDFFSKGFLKMKVRFLGSNRSTDRTAAPMYFKRQIFFVQEVDLEVDDKGDDEDLRGLKSGM